jgi:hypothetical protein
MIILPSLEIVPAKYNGSTLLSQIPIDGTGDFTVTRATTPTADLSTRVNDLGLIENVLDNVPRLDYLQPDGTIGCPALLVEPSATNLSLNSNSFSVETAPVATVVQNQVDIFGNPNSAWLMSGADSSTDASNANNVRKITPGFTSGSTYAGSIYIKSPTGAPVTFRYRQATVTTSTVASGDGWFRAVNISTLSSTSYRAIFYTDGGAPIIMCHSQAELGSVPTSYIGPVGGTAIVRAADVITDTTASGVIGQTEGTLYAEVDIRNFTNGARIFVISDGTQANRIALLFNTTNRIRLLATVTSATQADISTAGNLPAGIYKIAVAYATNDYVLYINGVQIGTDTTALVPACSSVFLGTLETGSGLSSINDRIRAAALYTTRLTNTQLALLTSPYTSYSSMASALSYTLG